MKIIFTNDEYELLDKMLRAIGITANHFGCTAKNPIIEVEESAIKSKLNEGIIASKLEIGRREIAKYTKIITQSLPHGSIKKQES